MVDTAAAAPAPSVEKSSGPSLRQLLLVPAILVPLISAVPVWFDKAVAFWKDLRTVDAAKAEEQVKLASRNISCLNAPYRYYQSSSKLAIDGTICKSGDVLVRVANEQQEGAIYWVSAEELKARIDYSRSKVARPGGATTAAWQDGDRATLLRTAVAQTGWSGQPSPLLQLVQSGRVTVLCSQQIDARHIRQRIRRPDGCFDQVIDIANGAVVSVTSAPCTC